MISININFAQLDSMLESTARCNKQSELQTNTATVSRKRDVKRENMKTKHIPACKDTAPRDNRRVSNDELAELCTNLKESDALAELLD